MIIFRIYGWRNVCGNIPKKYINKSNTYISHPDKSKFLSFLFFFFFFLNNYILVFQGTSHGVIVSKLNKQIILVSSILTRCPTLLALYHIKNNYILVPTSIGSRHLLSGGEGELNKYSGWVNC